MSLAAAWIVFRHICIGSKCVQQRGRSSETRTTRHQRGSALRHDEKMQATLAAQKPLSIQHAVELEKLFSIRSRDEEVIDDFTDSDGAAYRFTKETGRARALAAGRNQRHYT